nr:MAG TPA_asm: hypothetical protein [Caudoviricetes sp.]
MVEWLCLSKHLIMNPSRLPDYPRTGFVAWCYESMLVFNRNK